MIQYSKYLIRPTDFFVASAYPKVQGELDDMVNALKEISPKDKEQIVLSYLKEHSLKKELIESNPELAGLLTGGDVNTSHMQYLFDSCQQNKPFLKDFEDFIKQNLAASTH